jgi:transposase
MNKKISSESVIKVILRKTRKNYSSEENVRIALKGMRGEDSIANLCRLEFIPTNLYYR